MNFKFIGGSMGSAVGEKISKSISLASEKNCPLIILCQSGGARMQEGALSLMQLSKISTHLAKFSKKGGLYISILTYPTTCLLYTSPSPRDLDLSRMPSSA